MLRNKEELVRRLNVKPLPRAVRWYDPGVLIHTGIRDAISAVFGEYADQRLMQAATDGVKDKYDLSTRYDYSREADPFWVDYIADVGDGFGPTYGMATLLAKDELSLSNLPNEKLPAGRLLLLGGDQCYPQATHEEYEERFVLPYATALPPVDEADKAKERRLFAVPGNHDWYDGLGAFDNLFCQNRDQLLERGHGRRIGGWRCQQHRSYWAIRLPHNWWLWGVDIQFSKYLDAAQENYFRAVVDSMDGGEDGRTAYHNIVLCIAEPHWLDAEFAGVDTVDSLHTLVRIALKRTKNVKNRDVRVRAVLAGDWHHYSHYHLDSVSDPGNPKCKVKLDLPLIGAGGGGAFLHSTTDLRKNIDVSWGVRPENLPISEAYAPAASTNGKAGARRPPQRFTGNAKMVACYPSRGNSLLLGLRNLAFPLRNWKFSLVFGAFYWITTWQYYVVAKSTPGLSWLMGEMGRADFASINSLSNDMLRALPEVAAESIFLFLIVAALWAGLGWYVGVSEKRTPLFKLLVRVVVGSAHTLAHLKAMFMVLALCAAIAVEAQLPNGFYPFVAVPLGALAGGFVFGAYWVLAGLFARMHTGDAFGALGIRNYKNFLRMKFDKDSLTIYPIGVDKLPSTKWCSRELKRNPPTVNSSPLLKLRRDLKPFLIFSGKGTKEAAQPIVIPRIPPDAPAQPAEPARVAAE